MAGNRFRTFTLTGTSPTGASTSCVVGPELGGLSAYDWFTLHFTTEAGSGGTLDLVVERKIPDVDEWREWIRLPQLSSKATAKRTVECSPLNTITTVGSTTTAAPTGPTLALNTNIGGHPGDRIRLVGTSGASNATNAVQTLRVVAWKAQ